MMRLRWPQHLRPATGRRRPRTPPFGGRACAWTVWVIFALGAVARWLYIVLWHDPRNYVYSDMAFYVTLGKRLADPSFVPGPCEVTHPPGMAAVVALFHGFDP